MKRRHGFLPPTFTLITGFFLLVLQANLSAANGASGSGATAHRLKRKPLPQGLPPGYSPRTTSDGADVVKPSEISAMMHTMLKKNLADMQSQLTQSGENIEELTQTISEGQMSIASHAAPENSEKAERRKVKPSLKDSIKTVKAANAFAQNRREQERARQPAIFDNIKSCQVRPYNEEQKEKKLKSRFQRTKEWFYHKRSVAREKAKVKKARQARESAEKKKKKKERIEKLRETTFFYNKICGVCAGFRVRVDLFVSAAKFVVETAKNAVYATLRFNVVGALNLIFPFVGGFLGGLAFDAAASFLIYGTKVACAGISKALPVIGAKIAQLRGKKPAAGKTATSEPESEEKTQRQLMQAQIAKLEKGEDLGLTEGNLLPVMDSCGWENLKNQDADMGQWKRLKTMFFSPAILYFNIQDANRAVKTEGILGSIDTKKVQADLEREKSGAKWKLGGEVAMAALGFAIQGFKDSLFGFGEFGIVQGWIELDKADDAAKLVAQNIVTSMKEFVTGVVEKIQSGIIGNFIKRALRVIIKTVKSKVNMKAIKKFFRRSKKCEDNAEKEAERAADRTAGGGKGSRRPAIAAGAQGQGAVDDFEHLNEMDEAKDRRFKEARTTAIMGMLSKVFEAFWVFAIEKNVDVKGKLGDKFASQYDDAQKQLKEANEMIDVFDAQQAVNTFANDEMSDAAAAGDSIDDLDTDVAFLEASDYTARANDILDNRKMDDVLKDIKDQVEEAWVGKKDGELQSMDMRTKEGAIKMMTEFGGGQNAAIEETAEYMAERDARDREKAAFKKEYDSKQYKVASVKEQLEKMGYDETGSRKAG